MFPRRKRQINISDTIISIKEVNGEDYISLTDMIKSKDGDFFISDWLRNRNTLEFLSVWERIYNPNFNYGEFAIIKSSAGLNNFKISVKEWVERTNAKGIVSSAGRYGGTYAHRDIAFEFGTWINPTFKLYLIKEYQRLKDIETNQYNLEWNVRRVLSKVNYQIHTDAVQDNIVPKVHWNKGLFYADEADLLNAALFGQTAKEWRDVNPKRAQQGENIRDSASINELTILSNLESYNSELIRKKVEKKQRFEFLQDMAQSQAAVLKNVDPIKALKKLNDTTYLEAGNE
jgi:hypothetical protein